jgi:filamentous hemagglutinin family protein
MTRRFPPATAIRAAALAALLSLSPPIAVAHPTDGAAHNSATIGGTSPAARLPKLDLLPLKQPKSKPLKIKTNAKLATPADQAATVSDITTDGTISAVEDDGVTPHPASFFLINPAGVVFNANAGVALAGHFAATTAGSIRLGSQGRFDAATPSSSVLTGDDPVALDFSSAPAPLALNGTTLTGPGNAAVFLAGGDVTLTDATLVSQGGGNGGTIDIAVTGSLNVDGGQILANTTASGAGGGVSITAGDLNMTGNGPLFGGSIGTSTDAGATGPAGNVSISVATLELTQQAGIGSSSSSSANAGGTVVNVRGLAQFSDNSGIVADSDGLTGIVQGGNAGNIQLNTGGLTLLNGAEISSSTFGQCNGGTVNVVVNGSAMLSGSTPTNTCGIVTGNQQSPGAIAPSGSGGDISVQAGTNIGSSGRAGNITLSSATLTLTGAALLSSSTNSTGNAGNVTVTTGRLAATGGGDISSSTAGPGNAGAVTVAVSGSLSMSGSGVLGNSGVFSGSTTLRNGPDGFITYDGPLGNAGDVSVSAGALQINDGAQIGGFTSLGGSGGQVTVAVDGATLLDGSGTTSFTGINAQSLSTGAGAGDAGNIALTTGTLVIRNSAQISSSSFGSGHAGDVRVTAAGQIDINGAGSRISSSSTGSGNAGAVQITTGGVVSLDQSAAVSATSEMSSGGNVSVVAAQAVTLGHMSSISAQAPRAGQVSVVTPSLSLSGGSFIAVDTSLTPIAGTSTDVIVDVQNLMLNDSSINAVTNGPGNGGSITLIAPQQIALSRSRISAYARHTGGQIVIDPQRVLLSNGSVIDGLAGGQQQPVIIGAAAFIVSATSRVLTDKPEFNTDDTVVNVVGRLPGGPLGTDLSLLSLCGLLFSDDSLSSFVVTGRGGSPVEPGGWMPSLDLTDGSTDGACQKDNRETAPR